MWLSGAVLRRCLVISLCGFVACNSQGDSDGVDVLGPPSLEFLGATVSDGTEYAADVDAIELGCDARVTLHLGPRDESNELVNYRVRPPKYCGENDPCGFVRLSLLDAAGRVTEVIDAALLDVVLDFDSVDPRSVHTLRADLMEGISLEPEKVDGEEVRASWEVRFVPSDCPGEPVGGAGGGGGAGGAGPVP